MSTRGQTVSDLGALHAHSRNGMPAPLAIGILLAVLLASCMPTSAWIFPHWLSTRGFFSHGFLVVAMIAALVWRDRAAIADSFGQPNAWLLVPTLAGSVAWFAAWAASLMLGQIVILLAIAWFAIGALLGARALVRLSPYFALLTTAIPMWGFLTPPLQMVATDVVNLWLRSFGLTVFVEGVTIHTPHISFEVEGGCSGLGFLLTAACLSGYLALLHRLSVRQTSLLILGSLAIGLLVNWVRIFLIVTAGYHYGIGHFIVKDHVWFGWVVFGVIFLPFLFLIVPRLPIPAAVTASVTGSKAARVAPTTLAMVLIGAAALPLYGTIVDQTASPLRTAAAREIPAVASPYLETSPSRLWQPVYATAHDQVRMAYRRDSHELAGSVEVFAATYWKQEDRTEIININNDIVGESWRVTERRTGATNSDGTERAVMELRLTDGDGREMLLWFWYRVGDSFTQSATTAKVLQIRERLFGRSDAAVIAIGAFCAESTCTDAREALSNFLLASDSGA